MVLALTRLSPPRNGAEMEIYVGRAVAEAATELSAFDECLTELGIGDLNLIYLSSIAPPNVRVVEGMPEASHWPWGDRLYCVAAQHRTSRPGHEVWAGLGWVQDGGDGVGLFAEAQGASEAEVRFELSATLADMTERRPSRSWGEPEFAIAGGTCERRPVCALVIAAYRAEPWQTADG